MHAASPASPPTPKPPQPAAQPRTTTSDELLAGAVELHIEHRGEIYRLRRTAHDKLILTK